jgi:hypothetical protein
MRQANASNKRHEKYMSNELKHAKQVNNDPSLYMQSRNKFFFRVKLTGDFS